MDAVRRSPRAFISHASEDKERFVDDFATKLRARGIEAWLDQWELAPGDSLVDRIFEEGIGQADAFIVVLSIHSVHKRWVREELDAGLIKRINDRTRVIPVVIDNCDDELPTAVRHLVWHKVRDLNEYDDDVDKIAMAVHGYIEKPPLGEAPGYVRLSHDVIPSLDRVDSLVLKTACEKALHRDDEQLGADEILEALVPLGVSKDQVWESLEILDRRGYVEAQRLSGLPHGFHGFSVSTYGLEQYLRTFVPTYNEVFRTVGLRIVNDGDTESDSIIRATGCSRVLVDHVLEVMEGLGYLRSQMVMGGNRLIFGVSPELKRLLAAV